MLDLIQTLDATIECLELALTELDGPVPAPADSVAIMSLSDLAAGMARAAGRGW